MTPQDIEALFTRQDGSFGFARWGRAIVPIVFGVEDEALGVIKGAVEAVVSLAGHETGDMDAELGANLMFFFFRDWAELVDVPNLDQLIPDLPALVGRLEAAEASQYRAFRFDGANAIQASFVFIRMDAAMAALPAETLALGQVVQVMLTWGPSAFAEVSPLAVVGESGAVVLRPEIADVIRAAYDPVLPSSSDDASHALRLSARIAHAAKD